MNINDPAQAGPGREWKTTGPTPGATCTTSTSWTALLYASYWNDGLVILDIGNGKWGGRPDKPQLVSQFKYDLDSLYRQVEDVSGPGFIRGHPHGLATRAASTSSSPTRCIGNGPIQGAKDASSQPDVRHACT